MMGTAFTAVNVFQGAPLTPQLAALNISFLYAYGALICPMEVRTHSIRYPRCTLCAYLGPCLLMSPAACAGTHAATLMDTQFCFRWNSRLRGL